MDLKSRSGLTLVEFLVIVLVLGLLSAALFPAGTDPIVPNMGAVGARGKDIWVAVTGANQERAALGLAPLWPRDAPTNGFDGAATRGMPDFKNSTAYFAWLLDARDGDVPGWNPQAKGIDYSKLAGAGVQPCLTNGCLSAANNLWTVAKNVRDDMPDRIPVLITRNIEASSLAVRTGASGWEEKVLRFDPAWKAPFGKKGGVMICKGGAIFKVRTKYMTWGVVYIHEVFDTAQTTNGVAAPPLKYLTPTREVTPGPSGTSKDGTHGGGLSSASRSRAGSNSHGGTTSVSSEARTEAGPCARLVVACT